MNFFGNIRKLRKPRTAFRSMVTLIVIANAAAILFFFADVAHPPPSTGHDPRLIHRIIKAFAFLGVLFSPGLCMTIIWFVHLDQMRRGVTTFRWLSLPALAASVWTFYILFTLQAL